MSEMSESIQAPAKTTVWPKPALAWWTVAVLVMAFIFSIADRIIISLLVDPIKTDLQLSETDMGLLMGLYFALFYGLMGLPIGRLVDKYSRRAIVGTGIFVWSLMTALCGLSSTFFQLFFARAGVGIGQQAEDVAEICEWVDAGQLAADDDAEEHCGGMGAPL